MIRHSLHLKFIHHHRCSLAAAAIQTTTNRETTAIAAVTPELKELEPPVLFFPDGSECPRFSVTVIVGGAELSSRRKPETVRSFGYTSSTGMVVIVRVRRE